MGKQKTSTNTAATKFKEYAVITLGAILYVVSIKVFSAPKQIPAGGASGIALLMNYVAGLPIGVVSMALNVPLLIFGYKMLGRDFFFKTMYMTIFSSILTDVVTFLPEYDGDMLLAVLFGGIIKGLSFGLIIHSGGTSGGTDVISKFCYRRWAIPMGRTSMTVNGCVLIISAIFLQSVESLFYGIIMQYVVSTVMDKVIYGGDMQKKVTVITSKPQEIADVLMTNIGHGVTAVEGKGMYTGSERYILVCVIRRHEANMVKKLILDTDDSAFLMFSDVTEVLGRGFKNMSMEQ